MFIIFSSVASPILARAATIAVNAYLYGHGARDLYKTSKYVGKKYDQWSANRKLNAPVAATESVAAPVVTDHGTHGSVVSG